MKKIRAKVHYFGVWAEPTAAHEKYIQLKPYLEAGNEPPESFYTVGELIDAFSAEKDRMVGTGELQPSTRRDYAGVCTASRKVLGKRQAASLVRSDFIALWHVPAVLPQVH